MSQKYIMTSNFFKRTKNRKNTEDEYFTYIDYRINIKANYIRR